MNTIHLQKTLPEVFSNRDSISSDIWHRDFVFEKGKNYLIEADSGTGKSSLCSFVYGYRTDYQGIINFDGRNIKSFPPKDWTRIRQHSLSLLFQDLRLFSELTAVENVLIKNKLTSFKNRKEIKSLFETLGIAEKMDEKAETLSFGQQQKVAFIRCLCQPIDFIFLDEPISHLDDNNAHILADLLMEETRRQGAGVVVTSIGKHLEIRYDHILKL